MSRHPIPLTLRNSVKAEVGPLTFELARRDICVELYAARRAQAILEVGQRGASGKCEGGALECGCEIDPNPSRVR